MGDMFEISPAQRRHMQEVSAGLIAANPAKYLTGPYKVAPPEPEAPRMPVEPVVEMTPTEWLKSFLTDAPMPAKEVFASGKARGFGRKRILTAQKRLGIKPVQRARTWLWGLPGWEDEDS
jgi:hypothetical protein